MKRQKNNRGVTLIALVVTIIVMLILAGIGINSVIGNKGIFSNAEKSKNQTDISEEKSILKVSVISAMGADSVAGITKGNLEEALDKNVKNYDLTQKTDEEYGNVYEIKFKETGNTYTILDDGTILSEEEKENNISAIKILQDTNVVLEVGEKKTIALKENLDNIESVKWKNYGEDIVEIPSSSENAKSIEILGKKIGTTTIEVEVEIKNGSETQKKTEMCQVTVRQKYEGKEKSVKLDKTEFKIDLSSTEKTVQLKATVEPSNVKTTLKWKTSDSNVATVNENGLVTGVSIGTAMITVTTENGKTAQCKVIVELNPTEVVLNKTQLTFDMSKNRTEQLIATVKPENAMNNKITWSSSDSKKVKVESETGIVTALENTEENNPVRITATTPNGKSATCMVIVQTSPTSIALDKTNVTIDLSINKTAQLKETIYPSTANIQNKVTWKSEDPSIATVKDGLITGVKNGNTTITVTTENGKSATCKVTVQTSPTSVTLDQTNVTLDISTNKTVQLKATVNPSTANVKTGITWRSDDSSIATVKDGLVTGVKNGSTTITVTTENGKSATCKITVQTSPTSVTLNQTNVTLDISTNKTVQLTATINPSTANVQTGITWKSNDSSIATVKDGLITGVKNGSTTITVTTDNGKSATCKVTVQTSPTSVTLNQTNVTLDISTNKTVQLKATVNPSTANVKTGITWRSDDSSIATVKDGLVTGVKNGSTTITVTTENGKSATCKITVQTSPTSVTLNQTNVTLDISTNKTVQLTATINPSTANVQTGITWKSNDSSIATVKDGLVTGVKNGSTTITVTTDNGKSATCKVTVQTSPTSVTLNQTNVTLDTSTNKTVQLKATINPSTANVQTGITWKSNDSSIATVKDGLVTGVKNGSTTITVTTDNGKSATCKVTVQTSPTSVRLNQTNVTLDMSGTKTVQLKATVNPGTANVQTGITWKSNDSSIATVKDGLITGVKNGSTTITVTTDNGKSATCKVTVQTSPTSVRLNQTNVTLDMSGTKTVQLKATVNPGTANVQTGITWKSNDSSIATVKDGLITGVKNGSTTITVTTDNGKSATCKVTVQTSPTSVRLNQTNVTLDMSGTKTVQLKATVNPGTANVQTGITWSSNDPSIATVKDGLVTGVKNGTTTITVTTDNGKSASCKIIVQTTPTGVTLDQTNVTLDISTNKTVPLTATINPGTANINKGITWRSNDSSIATVDKNSGLVTGVRNGTTTITVTTGNGKTASCKVTVQTSPTSVTMSTTSVTLDLSRTTTTTLTATVNPGTANINKGITWSSNDSSIATVDKNSGLVTGVSIGTTDIIARTDNGKTCTAKVTVIATIKNLEVSPSSKDIDINKETQLTVKTTPGQTTERVVWETSNSGVATVDQTGKVKGISKGTAIIKARNTDGTIFSTATIYVAKTHYGWYVENYTAKTDKDTKWKVFYEDNNNTYIIADKWIDMNGHMPIVKNGGIFRLGRSMARMGK